MRSIIGAKLRENALDAALDGFLGDRKLIRNLLVGIAGRDQAQYGNFCWRQGVIRRMFGDFV